MRQAAEVLGVSDETVRRDRSATNVPVDGEEQIAHGGWERWVRESVGISPGTARMLMTICLHPALANRLYVNDFPPSYATLYEQSPIVTR